MNNLCIFCETMENLGHSVESFRKDGVDFAEVESLGLFMAMDCQGKITTGKSVGEIFHNFLNGITLT